MPLVHTRRVIGRVGSIALLPPPVANSGELCRFEAQIGSCVIGRTEVACKQPRKEL